ncbi:MAG: phospholipid carrier-dependent glycosyltransferase [Intestinimonas sp.]|nr:phospholipid carrier-dependent glycosyltransferase [Intestinimonas sp.]
MSDLLTYVTPTLLFPLVLLTGIFSLFVYYWVVTLPRKGSLEWIAFAESRPSHMTLTVPLHPMEKKDTLPLLLVTAAYAATAFFQLGNTTAPQSFQGFSNGQVIEFSLEKQIDLAQVAYYPGLGTGEYKLEVSADGVNWTALPTLKQTYSDLFKWLTVHPEEGTISASLFRITASTTKSPFELGELAVYTVNGDGAFVRVDLGDNPVNGGGALFDEQDVVPSYFDWTNSTYFDEIYHARTAFEHIRGVYPYEVSHPPLGKLILSLGIRMFGMTPFGWRFMGTLLGVLMLPILYMFLKNLFGKTAVACCGTTLFAFDFMHLTQTRIATIDTYGVFFILLTYFFMYRYLTLPAGTSFGKGALPLFLSGLTFGIGAACKWTVLYAGAGLAVLYFIGLGFRWRDRPLGEAAPRFAPWLLKTFLFSVLCFILIPACIYCASYYPYALAKGDTSLRGLLSVMAENQKFMFTYHLGVMDYHPYSSRWYQWIVDGRPILYYLDRTVGGDSSIRAAFACFNNPVVAWAGLLAVFTVAVQAVRQRSGKALFLVIGYLSQLVPWMFIKRTTFEYHYFPSTLFLVLCLTYVLDGIVERRRKSWKLAAYGTTGVSVFLYAAFYPVLIGLPVPIWYASNCLKWFYSWPF